MSTKSQSQYQALQDSYFDKKVLGWFKDYAKRAPINSELKNAVMRMNGTSEFLKRLSAQLVAVQELQMKRRGKFFGDKVLREAVEDFYRVYLDAIEQEAARRTESDIKKMMRKEEEDTRKDIEATEETGKPQGIFKDMDLQIGETTVDEEN